MTGPTEPPAEVQRITSEEQARALAHRLLTPGRRWPVVVVTIAAGCSEPFGDPKEIKEAVGNLAEVVLMPTSAVSWAFSEEMPELTQVYGGAGRVYPVDLGWIGTPTRSRLRFAYSPKDSRRLIEQLIHDAMGAALASEQPTLSGGESVGLQRSGVVTGIIGSRALIRLDDGPTATVWEELTLAGVALDRLFVKGQRVTGRYEPDSRRLDVRAELRYSDVISAQSAVLTLYQVGDMVLADVTEVLPGAVYLRLLPGLVVAVERSAITSNPYDALSDLFSVHEIVRCRIVSTEPLQLRLDDVEDDDATKPAPSLLAGGPPWLRESIPSPPAITPDPAVATDFSMAATGSPQRHSPPNQRQPEPTKAVTPSQRAPGVAPENNVSPVGDLGAERAARVQLAGELAALRARATYLEGELERERRSREQAQTRYRSADLERQRQSKQIKSLRSRLEQIPAVTGTAFNDPEQQFRHEVYISWVQRVPASEKATRPLPSYSLGPAFLTSLKKMEGVSRDKVVAVAVEVLTDQAQHLPGRSAHRLRVGNAGSQYVTREDGASCWRVALQQESAAARRLHYWRIGDHYELSRVVHHDDYDP